MRIFWSHPQPGDEVEATLAKSGYFRRQPHTIRGLMRTDDMLTYVSEVTGEVTEMGLRNLEQAGYKVRVVHHAAVAPTVRRGVADH